MLEYIGKSAEIAPENGDFGHEPHPVRQLILGAINYFTVLGRLPRVWRLSSLLPHKASGIIHLIAILI